MILNEVMGIFSEQDFINQLFETDSTTKPQKFPLPNFLSSESPSGGAAWLWGRPRDQIQIGGLTWED